MSGFNKNRKIRMQINHRIMMLNALKARAALHRQMESAMKLETDKRQREAATRKLETEKLQREAATRKANGEKPIVTCHMRGGLGNQLFQIFATIAYARKRDIDFCLPNFTGGKGIDETSARPSYWDNILSNLRPYIRDVDGFNLPESYSCRYQPLPQYDDCRSLKLTGYCQSPEYFKDVSDNIIGLIGLRGFQKEIGEKYSIKSSIALHFRIGDYRANSTFHPILSTDYYRKALGHIISKTDKADWTVRYCCEEQNIDEVCGKISELKEDYPKLTFERIDKDLADWQQMLYMSCCQHNIIANSSFSWWSAYLNEDGKKIVCYPSIWFGDGTDVSELFLGGWTKL